MKDNTTAKKVSKIDRLINGIEAVCNKLPPPAILFCWLLLFTAVLGGIFTMTGLTLTRPSHPPTCSPPKGSTGSWTTW